METSATPNPADILPKAIYYQVAHDLRRALPPASSTAPEDVARRDFAAIAHAASLLPANPDEAHLAALCVAAGASALDCHALAHEHRDDLARYLQCTAQAISLMRQALSCRNHLLRAQATRRVRDADAVARDTATQTEHRTLGLMAEGIAQPPPAAAPPDPPQDPDPIAEAEQYAQHHHKRAALIRKLRRLPRHINVGYIPPAVVHALINGTTPTLQALNEKLHRAPVARAT